jgi:hypothetical protein
MKNTTRIITMRDILEFLRHPIGLFICGILACLLAFNLGIQYSRMNVEVHSITRHLAFIEIAGEEHMYQLDWEEPEPMYWGN